MLFSKLLNRPKQYINTIRGFSQFSCRKMLILRKDKKFLAFKNNNHIQKFNVRNNTTQDRERRYAAILTSALQIKK